MISEARLRANRQNAQRSTGPTTERGKLRSRCNALKHGLTGRGVVLPEDAAEAVEQRVASWAGSLLPQGDAETWLARQAALASLRIDRCQQLECDRQGVEAARALACWDEDRMAEVERFAARLSREPNLVATRLRCSRQGCSWLLVRWRKLDTLIDQPGGWQDEHRSLALDLLGEPPEIRGPDLSLLASASPEALHAITRGEIDDLEALMADALDELDDTERLLAESGWPVAESPELRRIRRYEAACWRRFWWALGRLRSPSARRSPDPDLDRDLGPIPAPSPAAFAPIGPPRPIPAPSIAPPTAPRAEARPLADHPNGPAPRLAPAPRPGRAADPAPALDSPRPDPSPPFAASPELPAPASPRPSLLTPATSPPLGRLGLSFDLDTDTDPDYDLDTYADLDTDLDLDTDADTEPAIGPGPTAPISDSSEGTPGPLGRTRRPPAPDRRAIRKARRASKKRSNR